MLETAGESPYVDEGRTIWRAVTRDLDGLTIAPLHGAITIPSACVETRQLTE